MVPQAVNTTNHHCMWHCLAAICDASFDWDCKHSLERKGVKIEGVVGGLR